MDSTFERRYEYELLEEGPARGSSRHFYYPGASNVGGSDGLLIRVQPQVGDSWIGTFAFGRVMKKRGLSRVFATPNPDVMCVVANSEGYVVSASDPQTWEEVNAVPFSTFARFRRDHLSSSRTSRRSLRMAKVESGGGVARLAQTN
jgi:hypothetical protein